MEHLELGSAARSINAILKQDLAEKLVCNENGIVDEYKFVDFRVESFDNFSDERRLAATILPAQERATLVVRDRIQNTAQRFAVHF